MPPEVLKKLDLLTEQLQAVEITLRSLQNPSEIDPLMVTAITEVVTGAFAPISPKNANSEDQSVNESGSSSYTVLSDPVGFLEINNKHVPYYNA